MRHVALLTMVAMGAAGTLAAPARASCDAAPCVDAEPQWLAPAPRRFALVSDTAPLATAQLATGATFGFRLHPAVLTVPAPSRDGRDVNLLTYAVDLALAARWGLGEGLELTAVAPVGLYQRGAGIKGITDQNAPELPAQSLHDPRLGFGYAFDSGSPRWGAKLRFEAKLPLGNADALGGEDGPVASPSLAFTVQLVHLTAGLELGARLRRPVDFYATRVGSQGSLAAGVDYELPRPRLGFTLEGYLLPSLVARQSSRYFPAEWLASVRLAPDGWRGFSLGAGMGGGLPFSETPSGHTLALGVPAFRSLLFVRYAPAAR